MRQVLFISLISQLMKGRHMLTVEYSSQHILALGSNLALKFCWNFHAHSLPWCLWLLLSYNGRAEQV